MTADPTLFTSFEWVLAALAGLISLVLFPLTCKANKGSPFAERDEKWMDNAFSSDEPEKTGPKNENNRAGSHLDASP